MSGRSSAFTLVEIMVAMAIAMLLLVVVVQTFRSITATVRTVNQQSRENQLLRAGFIAVLEDADFYHSEANPDPPYGKGWTRAPLTAADPADRRHFALVVFDARTSPQDPYDAAAFPARLRLLSAAAAESAGNPRVLPNPNVLLPSDPRGWLRCGPATNSNFGYGRPQSMRANRYVLGTLPSDQVWGMYQLCAATDMRDLQALPDGTRCMPEDGLDVGPGRAVDPLRNQTVPCLQAGLWHYLSYIGVWTYLRPGAPVACHDTRGFLPAWYNLAAGQVVSTPLPPYYPTPSAPYTARPGSVVATQQATDYLNVGSTNYADLARWGYHTTFEDTVGIGSLGIYLAAIQIKPVYPPDTTVNGLNLWRSSSERTYTTVINQRPWIRANYNWSNTVTGFEDRSRTPAFSSTTYRFPGNPTDVERPTVASTGTTAIAAASLDLSGRPRDYPVMSTSIVRQHCFLGDQIAYCRVTVRLPEIGRALELPFSPVSTTFRGARQHWAQAVSTTLATPAGDRYATPGP